jgi:hypothetical protein
MPETPRHDDLRTRMRRPSSTGDAAVVQHDLPQKLPLGLPLRYQPIWNVQQKAISIYLGEPAAAADVGTDVGAGADPERLGRADRELLRHALVDIDAAARHRDVGSVCVPVHYATLANARPRGELLAICDAIPADLRVLLVWEIVGAPETIWENALFPLVSTIKPYARAIFMRQALDQTDFDVPAAVGIHSVGIDLRDVVDSETRCVGRLEQFAKRAHALGLRCHIHGLTTSSMSLTAIGAGFDYVAGPAISGSTEAPWGVLPYDAESLIRHNLAAAPARTAT